MGSSDGSLPTADPLPDAEAIFDLVWSVAHPVRRSRSMDQRQANARILRFCLPALGVDGTAETADGVPFLGAGPAVVAAT